MICAGCGYECGALEYDIEVGACLCPKCRADLGAEINPRRCPFCGAHDVDLGESPDEDGAYIVYCKLCRCFGPVSYNQRDAIKLWNKAPRVRE